MDGEVFIYNPARDFRLTYRGQKKLMRSINLNETILKSFILCYITERGEARSGAELPFALRPSIKTAVSSVFQTLLSVVFTLSTS
jgi:hypothetical protein